MMNLGADHGQQPGQLARLALVALVVFGNVLLGCATPPPVGEPAVSSPPSSATPPPPRAPAPSPPPAPRPPPPPAPAVVAPPPPPPPRPVLIAEKVTYAADAYFAHGSASLTPNAKAKLDELASKTQHQNVEVILAVGHASAGEAPSSEAVGRLSAQRAEAVKSYLVQLGVEGHRVYTEGKGAVQPVADNKTAEGRAKNRRVEIETVGTRVREATVAAPPPVVYNVSLAPQLPRDPALPTRAVLKAGLPTTLTFDLGPRSVVSVLPALPAVPAIVESPVDLPLTVVLDCAFCESQSEPSQRITFRPAEGRSDPARFQFTPQRRPDGSGYAGNLTVAIMNDQTGREYDRVVVPVAVAGEAPAVLASPGPAVVGAPSPVDRSGWQADVVLHAMVRTDRTVTLEIQPIGVAMTRLLGPLAFDAQGGRRVFRSGIDDPELVEAMTQSAYGAMSAVILQGDLLKKLSATGLDAVVSKDSQASLTLTPAESGKVSGVIAQSGQRLYRHLFSDSAETDLRKLILQLEAAAAAAPKSRPLRLTVVTNRLSLPWQYLHPVGPVVDAAKFWGMQFSLSVLRINTAAKEMALAHRGSDVRKVLFAHYGVSRDPTVALAEKQAAQLLKMPLAEADLVKVDTGADLLAEVSAQRKTIGAIVTFLHASSGSSDMAPNLQFNEGDIVTSDSLESLLDKVLPEEQDLRYLAGGPLVILNACETGPARNLPHVKLQNALFQLGAQGVVVTEVSVWISLGHEVATQLIERLARGEPVGDALTAVRRTLQEKRNPLGLLYVYYGDPAATFRH